MFNALSIRQTYKYYKRPFVLLFCALASGTLLGSILPNNYFFLFILLALTVLLFYWKDKEMNGVLWSLAIILCFVSIGTVNYQENSGLKESYALLHKYKSDDAYVFQIEEFREGKTEWNKCILSAKLLLRNGSTQLSNGRVLGLIQKNQYPLKKGDLILSVSDLQPIKNRGNPGEFNAENYWKGKGILAMEFISEEQFLVIDQYQMSFFENYLYKVRSYLSSVITNTFEGQTAAILNAIILGDKDLLDMETRNTFGNTGAMHVLAVSGLHVGIFMMILMFLFEKGSWFISRRMALVLLLLILWGYAFITGLSPSVIRAVFMFSMLAVSQLLNRKYDPINILFFTAFVMILIEPNYLFDIGFQLSYLAMLGIFMFYQPIENAIQLNNKILKKVWQGTSIGLAAQLTTIPLTLGYFHQFPNYFALSNLGLMVFSGLILGLGILLFSISFSGMISKLVSVVLGFTLFLMIGFLQWIEQLPGAVAKGYDLNIIQMIGLFLLPFLLYSFRKRIKHFVLIGSLGILLIAWVTFDRHHRMEQAEFIVFNSNGFLTAIVKDGKMICFYDAIRLSQDKVKMTVEDYSKMYPVEVKYFPLEKEKCRLYKKNIKIEVSKWNKDWLVQLNDKKIRIVSTYRDVSDSEYIDIGMPWIKANVDYNLSSGAYRVLL